MSLGQDPNPVHSPPMIELGLEGLQFYVCSFDLRNFKLTISAVLPSTTTLEAFWP